MKTFTFENKHILVTGAGGGLGSAFIRILIELGAQLVISDRSPEITERLQSRYAGHNRIIAVPADLSVPGEAGKLAETALTELGHIDVLINNAGIG
ncbi:SDR family oxidoreductase, partial [bacterium]|nr:SDR family oxidoreductase [bacterium]